MIPLNWVIESDLEEHHRQIAKNSMVLARSSIMEKLDDIDFSRMSFCCHISLGVQRLKR